MHKNHQDPIQLDLTKPRLASHKKKRKVHQDTENWVDIQLAQRKGLKFYQTRCNAIILYDTLPASCISKVVVMKSDEIIYQKVYVSPRPPPTISYKDTWTWNLDSDVARSNEDIQRIELKPNTQLSSTRTLVTKWSEKTLERTKFDRDTPNQEKHDKVTDSTSTERPVCGHKSTERCVLTPKHVANDQTGTRKPVAVDRKQEHKNWFQSARTVTLSCKGSRTSPSSRACEKDRISSSSREHFMPPCSRVTSTIHSAKIRRRWSVNWVMWSFSSCAKLYPKYNVLTFFVIGIKELCTALADNAWLKANPEESLTN